MMRRPIKREQQDNLTFVLLPMPDFSMVSLVLAIEPPRSCNRLGRRETYRWHLASFGNPSVQASNGIALPTVTRQDTLIDADLRVSGQNSMASCSLEVHND